MALLTRSNSYLGVSPQRFVRQQLEPERGEKVIEIPPVAVL